MSDFFRIAWEAADDSGSEPVDETPEVIEDAAVEDAPAEETYTRSQLAELLGPRFERFSSHEGDEAFKQFGQAYDNATGLIRQGGHLTRQEEDAYRAAGIDPSDVQVPQQDEEPAYEAPGLFGVPWQEPTTWEEVQAYANSDDPSARRLAAMAVMKEPTAPEETKQAYFSHWAAIDPAGAALYNQQAMQAEFDRRLAERDAAWEEKFGAVSTDLVNRNANDLMETIKAQVPGFVDHAKAVTELWNERAANEPSFAQRFLSAPRDEQLREMRRLTIIAAAESAPQRKVAQAQAAEATDAAKIRSRTETSRSNSTTDPSGDLKRQSMAEAERVFGQVR